MSISGICPHCLERNSLPEEVANTNTICVCARCGYRNQAYLFFIPSSRRTTRHSSIPVRTESAMYGLTSRSVSQEECIATPYMPSDSEISIGIMDHVQDEFRRRLVNIIPNAILEEVVNTVSRQILLRTERENFQDLERGQVVNLRWCIDDRRNGIYVTPLECTNCKFIFYVNQNIPSLICPQCRSLIEENIYPFTENNETEGEEKNEKEKEKKDEIRRIR
jgi:predicted Zn-ribbon and HTH transcriptional regulator